MTVGPEGRLTASGQYKAIDAAPRQKQVFEIRLVAGSGDGI